MTLVSPSLSSKLPGSTDGSLIRIEDQAGPFMAAWARTFPKEFGRALRSLGYWLKAEHGRAMRSGGRTVGRHWGERSKVSQYRPFDRLRRSQFKSKWKSDATHEAGSLSAALGSSSPLTRRGSRIGRVEGFGSGRLHGKGGVAYRYEPNKMQLQVGFLDSSAAYARMLQGGLLGAKLRWPFMRRQPVTPKMRRMFWAAGVPISKSTTVLDAAPKPLVRPLFERKRGEMLTRMELRIHAYIKGLSSTQATAYVYKNFSR